MKGKCLFTTLYREKQAIHYKKIHNGHKWHNIANFCEVSDIFSRATSRAC
jgi:hypothetical protein